jgi:hypothetical protein
MIESACETVRCEEQFWNALVSIFVTELGSVTDLNEEQH